VRQHEIAKKVLGKALLDAEAVLSMLRTCDHEDFPPDLRPLFLDIRDACLEGRYVNVDILADQEPKLRDLLLRLVTEEAAVADQSYWVGRLKECAQEERVVQAVAQISDLLLKDERPYGAKNVELQRLWYRAMAEGTETGRRLVTAREILEEEEPAQFYSVGFLSWEELTEGLSPGTIHVLAGRPGRGKSTLSIQWANGLAKAGVGSLLIPLEMGAKRTAKLQKDQGNLEERVKILQDPPSQWPTLALDLKWAIQAGEIKGVFIDHLGYLKLPRRKDQTRVEEIGEILRSLRDLMERTGAACVLVCQLSRAVEQRRSEMPTLSDLRESGEIEQEADTVNFLWAKKDQLEKAQGRFVLTVAKNRYGPPGHVEVIFDRPRRRFIEGP
jgi:replicative DNA helicase